MAVSSVPFVLSQDEQQQPHLPKDEATTAEHSSSTSSLSVPCPGSRNMISEVSSSSEASPGRGRSSFIGLSDSELLKCAFSYPQSHRATESPGVNGELLNLLWETFQWNVSTYSNHSYFSFYNLKSLFYLFIYFCYSREAGFRWTWYIEVCPRKGPIAPLRDDDVQRGAGGRTEVSSNHRHD